MQEDAGDVSILLVMRARLQYCQQAYVCELESGTLFD